MTRIEEIEAEVKALRKATAIYRSFSRGRITWAQGKEKLLALGFSSERANAILLGTV